jgi:hypothetical protein
MAENRPQFPIFRKRNICAWRTDNPNQIESPQQISIYAHAIWQRKGPVSEAIVRKLEPILPVGRISDAQRSIAASGLRSVIPLLCLSLLSVSVACGHGRACWRPARVANDPNRSCTSLPTTDRLRGSRCSLTASCLYDMLMLLVEENGFHGMPPNRAGEMR